MRNWCSFMHIFTRSIMKKLILVLLSMMAMYRFLDAQPVYKVSSKYDADVKVFAANSRYDADLIVYEVKSKYDANKDGLWFFTNSRYDAKKKIYFVDSKYDADIIIYFANSKYDAGWRNSSKIGKWK